DASPPSSRLFPYTTLFRSEPVPDGVTGEVVFTTLTRTGMPLIRYRTGDLSRFIPEGCACGTVLKSLDLVQGRLAGRVRLGNQARSEEHTSELQSRENLVCR